MGRKTLCVAAFAAFAFGGGANASLVLFNSYTGNDGVSTDGCGSTAATCTLQSNIPAGSSILGAFLYSSTFSSSTNPNGTSLNAGANTVTPTFTPLGVNNGFLQAWRADVTSFVAANATLGSTTTWTANEGNQSSAIDGEALVVVFSNPLQPSQTVFILDGFSASSGDTASVFFDPLQPGFLAQMMIGDGFSFDGSSPSAPTSTGQTSTISVNGTTLTTVAGHCDDAQNTSCADGNLITVGSFNAGSHDNAFTPFPNPTVGQDHERYNLGNILAVGDTHATVNTRNASGDDNIFLEVFNISGRAAINAPPPPITSVPEPATLALLAASLGGLFFSRRKRS